MKFLGRTKELESLELLLKKKSASLVVIRGRRRVLIHVNGVSQSINESDMFNDVVDFSQFLDD